MGRGSKRQRNPARAPGKTQSRCRDDRFIEDDDMDDEIDAFHKQRDMVPLDGNGDNVDSDDDLELPVFDIEGVGDKDSDDSESDDDDHFPDDKETAKMARQAKYLERMIGGDVEMDEDSEQEEGKNDLWGRNKHSYYNADNVDYEIQSSDEEGLKEEEDAVKDHLRKRAQSLKMGDFGLDDADQDENDSDGQEKTIQGILTGKKGITQPYKDGALEGTPLDAYEEIKKDFSALSKEEKMNVVYSSTPELPGLLSELNEVLNQLKNLKPLLFKVRERKKMAKDGMHYVEVKHILLLTYCQAISFYLLLKSEGHSVRDHPVIARLVEIKNLFEKMKEIDAHFPSKIEELIDQSPVKDFQDQLAKGSVSLETKPDTTEVSAKSYKISMVNGAAQSLDDNSKHDSKSTSQKHQEVQMGLQSMEMLKLRAKLEEKLKQDIYSLKIPSSERIQNHAIAVKPFNRRLQTSDDFDDEVHHDKKNGAPALKKISKLATAKANMTKFMSGDDDLPKRDDIGERRRKHELRVLAGAGAGSMDIDVQEDDEAQESEDEFYKEVKKQRTEKIKTKEELYSRSPAPLSLETTSDGKRLITSQMEKNRGLTRPRKKDVKIPRKKYRVKHQKAVIRRKGQVRDIRKPTGPYGGESTGINTNVSRSRRFKN